MKLSPGPTSREAAPSSVRIDRPDRMPDVLRIVGRFQGAIQGDLLTLEWVKPGNPVAAIMPVRGKGYLRIIQSGKRLEGRWGYDDSIDDGGKWTAEKSQFQ